MYDSSRADGSSSVGVAIVAVLAGIVFLGGVVGIGGGLWMYSRTHQLRALEERARAEAMRAELLAVEARAKAEALRADALAADALAADALAADVREERHETELAPNSTDVTIRLPREKAVRLQQGIQQIVSSSESSLPSAVSEELKELETHLESALKGDD